MKPTPFMNLRITNEAHHHRHNRCNLPARNRLRHAVAANNHGVGAMKLTEQQYANLWHRHRRLELETQVARRTGAGQKTLGTQYMRTAVYNEMKCGRWLSIQDVAHRLNVKREVAERHLRELRREGKLVVEFHHDFASYKIKKEKSE